MRDLETLFDLSADLLCVAGMDGYFRRVNPAFRRVLGYSEQELVETPFIEFVHPEDRPATLAEVEKLQQGVQTLEFENRYRCKDGTYKWLEWKAVPNKNDDVLYAVGRDVTASKHSWRQWFDDLPGMAYRCINDDDWTMEYLSGGCRTITGYEPDDLLGSKTVAYSHLIHPDDRQRVWLSVQTAVAAQREYEIEYRIIAANGTEKTVWERGRAILSKTGEPDTLQGFIADITDRSKLRNELNQLQRMDSLGQLTGGIAHDFNNLLAVVIGNLELLEESTNSSDCLQDAMDAAWRAANLSQRLLAFARRQMLTPEVVSVAPLVYGMRALLERTLGPSIEVELHLPDDLPFVHVDVGQLENAILNLSINSRDAMPSGGKLVIRATRFKVDDAYLAERPDVSEGTYVMIEVGDTGTGMTAETMERVFEPFFTTKDIGKGTGLGLSMVYGFLKQSGGHARIYSELEHGTSVKLYLPAATELEAGETTQALALLQPLAQQKGRILVVDDEPFVRRIVVANLQGMGYEILEAGTAQSALDVLHECAEGIDLLLTDVVMPGGMTGIELAEVVRSAWPKIRILLTSGFSEEQVARGSGFPLLGKPYRKVQLAQAVRRALDGVSAT